MVPYETLSNMFSAMTRQCWIYIRMIIITFYYRIAKYIGTAVGSRLPSRRAERKRADNGIVTVKRDGSDDDDSTRPRTYRAFKKHPPANNNDLTPLSVNYHFTRQCNYKCGFCFHTAKTSFVLPLDEAKHGLRLLQESGMKKVNFSGGEPFLEKKGEYVGELVQYCKQKLELESVTIVSNGSRIKEKWFEQYGNFLDILAISCDSFDPEVNSKIGRQEGNRQQHVHTLKQVRDWCIKYQVAFKMNTVVNIHNKDEDMSEYIEILKPCRWKVFQCLLLEGENCGEGAKRHAESFVVSKEDFQSFLDRHRNVSCGLVPESNTKMQNSYLILDERMRFLDCTRGAKTPSRSILDVGVQEALNYSGFDEDMFFERGGKYKWSKQDIDINDW
ncbi:S-adenosylmethionine-dependent nucleotide dehydratase RSAD2-like [Tubulanus polymorphus]|uniref:S-adenosylmethionine-dependent nucleotide dehydratase RSAD2-like n=1 Tax=Tubulanus polymorphus TaxID=672921 RepID=UPI003DA347F1